MQVIYSRELTNEEILRGFRENDVDVMVHLYKTSYRSVKNYVLKNNGNEEDAKDVFQEGLMIVWKKIEKKQMEFTSKFYTYIFAVCKLLWMDELRKRSNKLQCLHQYLSEKEKYFEPSLDFELEQLKKKRKELFLHYFNKLNAICKTLIIYHLRGLSIHKIREKLRYSSDEYAKFRKFLCKKLLIEQIVNSPKYQELC